jgi:hypothetical protein
MYLSIFLNLLCFSSDSKGLYIPYWAFQVSGVFMTIVLKYSAVVMPCDFDWSWANIYGSSVGWLENTSMSTQPICYLYWKESK